jgi:hypothetical protein
MCVQTFQAGPIFLIAFVAELCHFEVLHNIIIFIYFDNNLEQVVLDTTTFYTFG